MLNFCQCRACAQIGLYAAARGWTSLPPLRGVRRAERVLDWLLGQEPSGRVEIPAVDGDLLRRARAVQRRFAALGLDLTDAVNVVVAERYETETILTLDRRDFRAVQPLTGAAAFRLLPDDM